MPQRITPEELIGLVGSSRCPAIVDVRRRPVFETAPTKIAGARWRDHLLAGHWVSEFQDNRPIVVYCAHGHNVSEIAAAKAGAAAAEVLMLAGGIAAYEAAGGTTVANSIHGIAPDLISASVWITRERPKIDRIACPWLIRRFLDPEAVIHFVAAEWVKDVAAELDAVPFDIEGVHYSHRGAECTFDTMLDEFGLRDSALRRLARIVRAGDTASLEDEAEAAGLLALSLGLSAMEEHDSRQLEKGMILYDALYAWCRHATQERNNWPATA